MPSAPSPHPAAGPEDAPPSTIDPGNAPPSATDSGDAPSCATGPEDARSSGARRLRRLGEPAVFLLVICVAVVAVLLGSDTRIPMVAAVVSAVCAVWQILRGRR